MKYAITLNKEIQCETLCKMVQKIVSKFAQENENISQSVLVMDIVKITDGGDNHIPKLEYKSYQ